jgi:transposase
MDQRTAFLADSRRGLFSMAELCARYGISRKTGYKWVARAVNPTIRHVIAFRGSPWPG